MLSQTLPNFPTIAHNDSHHGTPRPVATGQKWQWFVLPIGLQCTLSRPITSSMGHRVRMSSAIGNVRADNSCIVIKQQIPSTATSSPMLALTTLPFSNPTPPSPYHPWLTFRSPSLLGNTRDCIYNGQNSTELWGDLPVVLLFGDDYQLIPIKAVGAIQGYASKQEGVEQYVKSSMTEG